MPSLNWIWVELQMSPSEQDILRLWELYDEAEGFITEISMLWDDIEITPVNQLRYAGRHLLNSLTGKTSIAARQGSAKREAGSPR